MNAGPEHEDPDVQLMLKVKSGDRTAFEELVRRHSSLLVNFMFKFVGSLATAEDLAQEAFFKVFKAAPTYEPTARFKTWLLTIAANLCMNRKRWEKRRFHHSLDASGDDDRRPADEVAGSEAPPSADMERSELRVVVRRAVLSLPESQRLAVILARYHELSYAEIAESMDLTIMAVKSLLNRAKENLRVRLERELKMSALPQTGLEL